MTCAVIAIFAAKWAVHEQGLYVPITEAQCSLNLQSDPARGRRLIETLYTTSSGRELLDQNEGGLGFCFGRVPVPAIMTNGTIILDTRDSDEESAARLGHLLLHALEGMPQLPRADDHRSCDEIVEEAIKAEARAHDLELRLRRELGVAQPRHIFDFEHEYWDRAPQERLHLLEEHFRSNDGRGNGLIEAYRSVCRERE